MAHSTGNVVSAKRIERWKVSIDIFYSTNRTTSLHSTFLLTPFHFSSEFPLLTNGCLAALDLSWMDIGLESCFTPRYTSFPSGNATILSAMELHPWCDAIQGG